MELTWQQILYPLGLVSSVFFTMRVLYQWAIAEVTRSSPSPRGFWILSMGGNASHMVHSLLQMQLPLALVQGINLVISHRNFNLLQKKKYQYSFGRVILNMALVTVATLAAFFGICYLSGEVIWMRVPTFPILGLEPMNPSWWIQAMGLVGIVLYGTRFWVQWFMTEKTGQSHFSITFWVLSLTGAILSSIYFIVILDWVNILGTCFTLIPYARNLFFLRRKVV